jgi:serine/threonine protein kinase
MGNTHWSLPIREIPIPSMAPPPTPMRTTDATWMSRKYIGLDKPHSLVDVLVVVQEESNNKLIMNQMITLPRHHENGEILGFGTFSTVIRCTNCVDINLIVAVKLIEKNKLNKTSITDSLFVAKEVEILLSCAKHPNCINIIEFVEDDLFQYLVMPSMEGGELYHIIASRPFKASEYFAQMISRVIVDVLTFLHAQGIVYRDLKPENILFRRNFSQYKSITPNDVVLVDFGCAKKLSNHQSQCITACGSEYYIAPEIILGIPYDKSVDIWSFGILLHAMLAGVVPFTSMMDNHIFDPVASFGELKVWNHISNPVKSLLAKCLRHEPKERITLHQLAENPWICSRASEKIYSYDKDEIDHSFLEQQQQQRRNTNVGMNNLGVSGSSSSSSRGSFTIPIGVSNSTTTTTTITDQQEQSNTMATSITTTYVPPLLSSKDFYHYNNKIKEDINNTSTNKKDKIKICVLFHSNDQSFATIIGDRLQKEQQQMVLVQMIDDTTDTNSVEQISSPEMIDVLVLVISHHYYESSTCKQQLLFLRKMLMTKKHLVLFPIIVEKEFLPAKITTSTNNPTIHRGWLGIILKGIPLYDILLTDDDDPQSTNEYGLVIKLNLIVLGIREAILL